MNEKLGNLIRDSREAKGISQRELARITGVDNAAISRIEKGNIYKPNYLLLTKIAKELNIDLLNLVLTANYSLEEAKSLGLCGVSAYFKCVGFDRINEFTIKDTSDNIRLSYIKILNGYKEGKLNIRECTGLLCYVLDTDIRDYLTDEELSDNNLEDVLKFSDE